MAQLTQLQLDGASRDADAHVRVSLRHFDEERCHKHGPGPRTQTNSDHAGVARFEQINAATHFLGAKHQMARACRDGFAERREFVSLAHPVDQAYAQVVFQHLDTATQCRLRQMQLLCGTAEGSGFG